MSGTGIAWPLDAVAGAPSYTGRMLRNTLAPALAGATAARPLGGISGVRPGTPATTVSATSTTYTVTPFAGTIDLESAAISGPYAFAFNANVTGAVTAANASNPRADAVYVQINDNAEGDGTVGTPNVKIDYLAGTVNVGGTLVIAAVPARSFVLATINVPISGGGSPSVTWNPPYTVAAGGILPVPTTVYPAGAFVGQYVDDAVYGLLRFDGTAWGTSPVPRARITKAAAQNTSGTPGTYTALALDTETFDVLAMHSNVTNNSRVQFPRTGYWRIVAQAALTTSAAATMNLQLSTNGTAQADTITAAPSNGVAGALFWNLNELRFFTAGDYIELLITSSLASQPVRVANTHLIVEYAGS